MLAIAADTSLSAFAEELSRQGLGIRTVQAYVTDLEGFFGSVHAVPDAVLSECMRNYLGARRASVAPSTLRRFGVSFKRYLDFVGESTGVLSTYRMPPPRPRNPRPIPGGIEMVRKMLADTAGGRRTAIALGALGGLRVAESVSVDASCIDWNTKVLSVFGKGEKVRHVPISRELAAILRAAPSKGPLAPITAHQLRHELDQQARIHSLGQIGSHDLRCTFATTLYAKTKDVVMVSRLLGHSSVATTQLYLGHDREAAAMAVEF